MSGLGLLGLRGGGRGMPLACILLLSQLAGMTTPPAPPSLHLPACTTHPASPPQVPPASSQPYTATAHLAGMAAGPPLLHPSGGI